MNIRCLLFLVFGFWFCGSNGFTECRPVDMAKGYDTDDTVIAVLNSGCFARCSWLWFRQFLDLHRSFFAARRWVARPVRSKGPGRSG